jgi:hypothetical protein
MLQLRDTATVKTLLVEIASLQIDNMSASGFPVLMCLDPSRKKPVEDKDERPQPMLQVPHLRRDWAHPCHICAGTGLISPTSAPGLRSPLPHLSAPGSGSFLPHLRQDWAHRLPRVQASFVQSKKACSSVAFYDTMELLLQVCADAISLCVCAMATQARCGVKCGNKTELIQISACGRTSG